MIDLEEDVLGLWAEYKATGDRDKRDRLIVHYSPLVKYVAGRVGSGLPQSVDHGDLVSYGIFGLIDAIDKFDNTRQIKFETYAIARIKGAIIDELRSIDWVPRSVRAKAKQIDRAVESAEHRYMRAPTHMEVAGEMGVGLVDLEQAATLVSSTNLTYLDAPSGEGAAESLSEGQEQPYEVQQMHCILADAISCLEEKEQMVFILYYRHGLTLADVGLVFGVTESRACQIHSKAMAKVQARLRAGIGV